MTATSGLEREPAGVVGSGPVTSVYHDTQERRLARAGISLRRRTEHGKSVWQLILPTRGPEPVAAALGGPAGPPPAVARLLAGVVGRHELLPVLTVRTRATEDGSVEWDPEGARGLGLDRREEAAAPADDSPVAHVRAMLARRYGELVLRDPGVRLGDDAHDVHQLRVAVRRLRALLRGARPLLDEQWSEPLREELRWLGRSLGALRDLDVLIAHVEGEAADLPEEDRPAASAIVAALRGERADAHLAVLETLGDDRYVALLDELEQAAHAPRVVAADVALAKLAADEFRKLRRAVRKLGKDATDEELHRVRIKAKRARYAAELAEAVAGKRATRFIAAAKRFQDVAGQHQDAIVAAERLRSIVVDDEGARFVLGRLVERQRWRRREARAGLAGAWKELERTGRRAWS